MNFKTIPFLHKCQALAITGLLLAFTSFSTAQQPTSKKLIQYGWDRPTPEYLRDNLPRMEQSPFDGVVFKLPGDGGEVFNIDKWAEESPMLQQQLPILADLKWNTLTDNFLVIRATSTMDWFSDDDWATVLAKVTLTAKAAKAAHAKGIVFDPEPYGKNPWEYAKQKHAQQKSFAEYSAQANARGKQFIAAMQGELPELKLLMFYQYVLFYGAIKSPDDPALQKHHYGLMLPFLNGMLEEAGDKVQLIDGNEHSYSVTKAAQFERSYKLMREPQAYIPPSLHTQYRHHVRAAQAVYIDLIFGERRGIDDFSKHMTPAEQMRWFEHNLYHAYQQSDEYVWVYNEQVQWWRNRALPPGINDTIVRTKARIARNEPLGYDVDASVQAAKDKQLQARQDKLQKRSATLPRLDAAHIPHIDGNLDEAVYTDQPWTAAFVNMSEGRPPAITAPTTAWLAYTDTHLYVAFRSEESDIATQVVSGDKHDSQVWSGENVTLSILQPGQPQDDGTARFFRLTLNPANVRWDALAHAKGYDLAGFNPTVQTAVAKSATGWTAEIALPWSSLNITPQTGLQLRANLQRRRRAGTPPKIEDTSWSQYFKSTSEPENFGIWTLQ